MSFTVPTLDEMHAFLVAMAKALFPELDVSRTSFPALFTKVFAAGVTDNHAHLEAVKNDLIPDTSEGALLDRWGAIVGRTRKGATPALKADALLVVNDSGTNENVTVGQLLVHDATGLQFQINENKTVNAGDSELVDVLAVDTGSRTRLEAGEILRFVTPPSFINETAELQLDLDEGGDDLESDGDYRRRILARFSTPPLGGAQEDYVQWALELEGIDAAFCYPNRAGLGTVDVAALKGGTGAERILNASEMAVLLAHLEEERPVHATVRVLEVLEQPESVEVRVLDTGEEEYAWDWNDSTPLIVDSYSASPPTIVFTTDRPDTMQAGHRIVIKKADGTGDGEVLVIESLSGTDTIILEEAPSVAPVNGDEAFSGGALTEPVRDAILEHIDNLGTANPDATRYGEWEGNLRTTSLARAVASVDGVLDHVLEEPAANVESVDPAYPDDATIYLIVPERVLVRRKW
jgi:uncharacterized phage protein gp47/JayE